MFIKLIKLVSIKKVSRTSNYSLKMIDNTFVCIIICIITYNNPVQNIYAHAAKIWTQVQPGLFSIKNFIKFIVSLSYSL